MIFRPKLDNGAARGDDEKMQARTKAARALDRALGAAMLWGLSFLWFATRLGALWPAAALAAGVGGWWLLHRHWCCQHCGAGVKLWVRRGGVCRCEYCGKLLRFGDEPED